MACKYMVMRFKLTTTVDITESRARKGEDEVAYGQQQNYMTIVNVLGLRCNIDPLDSPQSSVLESSLINSQPQKVWEFKFETPEEATSVEIMQEDFELIPFVNNLTETTTFRQPVFTTTGKKPNIMFEILK